MDTSTVKVYYGQHCIHKWTWDVMPGRNNYFTFWGMWVAAEP